MRCSKCGADNREIAKFCDCCGAALGELGRVNDSGLRAASVTGERRHLTVLFCDLVGSTALSVQLDPEEWQTIVASYHRVASSAIERFGGHVAQYLGDGVMAYFGWPAAHEDDAERAVRAGLAVFQDISTLNEQIDGHELSAR